MVWRMIARVGMRTSSPGLALWVALGTSLGLLATILAFPRVEASYLQRAQAEGAATLRLVTDAVDQAVGRFDPVPKLIADDPILVELLRNPGNQGVIPFVNEKLRQTALSVGASDVYVMDRSGLTVAASNYRSASSFMSMNFAYRPYFSRALTGEAAQFHALGTTSGERGFFFSAPVLDGIEVIGVLAVKVTVDAIEANWAGAGREIIVADENGIAFLSSRADYRMRSLLPLSDGVRGRIAQTRQFPLDAVTPIPLSANVIAPGVVEVRIEDATNPARYLSESQPLQLPGWHAIVLTPLQNVRVQAINALVMWGLALTAVALGALVLLQRRASLLERVRIEKTQNDLLELKVQERTADLNDSNASLRTEVAERHRAEERLRKTQKELIQAGKLAALGQMSAALSHEINQPLAAVKSYADNASQYLKRNRIDEAGENIQRISTMTDRMAEISRHLRNFARQPGEALKPVPVAEVVREAIALVQLHERSPAAQIAFNPPDATVWALGGRLRLQQVLVNILNNALDAMADSPSPAIDIHLAAHEGTVSITVRDHGPGLPADTLSQVFDAFYTTKEAGAGMGLGMSISHNIVSDFGGTLSAENHPDGGAVFTVVLQHQDAPSGEEAVSQ